MSDLDPKAAAEEPPEDVAAAFVLGLLGDEAWREARDRLATDASFAAEVEAWEARLTPMVAAIEAQSPGQDLWPLIRRRLPANAGGSHMPERLTGPVAFWRGLSAASALIAVASLVFFVVAGHPAQSPTPSRPPASDMAQDPLQVALLKPDKGPTAFVATLDRTRKLMTVSPGAAATPKGRDLELWMIPPGGKPQALGVIPSDHPAKMPMPDVFAGSGDTPIVLAVSVEPVGGSPTGQPTGPVIARGRFQVV